MGWLLAPVVASWVIAYLVVRIFDYVVGGATGKVVEATRAGLFVSAWTAVTAGSGMRDFDKRVRRLRGRTARAFDALTRVSGSRKKG